ncbi:sigma factor [Phytoactinopolyspora mesophila]|uniref:RNA polymerase sigma-70 region 2 domain-containing protein n=1 Tax=Phytoactinopolyspora mesophila TaxID=2650750 RepID=A0A7K3MC48_9ACTN|nr:sigma factor [Phytoactinopolyspora mesophila]NDL60532.1 hypothetical protein [Phytoactinopolyspora mesophila]
MALPQTARSAADLAASFAAQRPRLRAIAYRMLGSYWDADDAVQETWLRLQRTKTDEIDNLEAWLTVVISRTCVDQLRARDARQLASRARRRIRDVDLPAERDRQRDAVDAFLKASREGDFGALLQLLDPDVELQADAEVVAAAAPYAEHGAPLLRRQVRGADAVARVFAGRAEATQIALIDGFPGATYAPGGTPRAVFVISLHDGRVSRIDVIGDATHLDDLAVVLE